MTPTILLPALLDGWKSLGRPNFMRAYLWVSLGALLGANLRYFVSRLAAKLLSPNFPYGTLIINVTGSFILGLFLIWTTERVLADPKWRGLIAIGFCGSYPTFSSYAFETIAYFEQGHWSLFALNIASNNLLCLAAVVAGAALARSL
jgi:fluoride exporter